MLKNRFPSVNDMGMVVIATIAWRMSPMMDRVLVRLRATEKL